MTGPTKRTDCSKRRFCCAPVPYPFMWQAAELASHRAELREMLQTTAERLEVEREVATAAQSAMARAEEALRAAEAQVRTPAGVSGRGAELSGCSP